MQRPSTTLQVSQERGVATVLFDRPEARNALNRAMVDDLHRALDALRGDPDVRAVVFTGAGERAFVSGADIGELLTRDRDDALARINTDLFHRIAELELPTVAAIRGYCLGGGNELAIACDLRVAGRSARFGQPEVALGILPGAGATYRLPRLIGEGRAKELIFTGRIIDADEALGMGLVNRVVDDDQVLAEARAMAETVAGHACLAVRMSKASIHASRHADAGAARALESTMQAVLFESEDKRTRMQAFLDRKRRRAAPAPSLPPKE